VDPSTVLDNVVDDTGHQCPVGEQQDSMEYLLNFMERLEEGLGEDSTNISSHLRVSEYQKRSGGDSESFLTDSSELGRSTIAGSEASEGGTQSSTSPRASLPGYSHIEDSFFQHAATQERPPVRARAIEQHSNTIYENFFGSHITVTKLLNKDTR